MVACLLMGATMAKAQVVKAITVAQDSAYTDHLALQKDNTDKDLMVKFVFDEGKNTLTVSLVSYRMLFVFWNDTRYRQAIKRRWIRTDDLPYVVTSNPTDRFRLTKECRNALPKPYKDYIFKKCISVDGLQPAEQELKMVNDYIEQTFDIQGKRTEVKVELHDLFLMDLVKEKGVKRGYDISFGQDLKTTYNVTIQRNPCFGLDDEIKSSQNALTALKKQFSNFKKRYGKGTVSSQEGLKAFQEIKATMTAQYPKNTDYSPCPDIQSARDQYNLYVDSIAAIKVQVNEAGGGLELLGGSKGRALDTKTILANARHLDKMTSRWLISKDELEREDLSHQCESLIKDTQVLINAGNPQSSEDQNAVKIFRQAEKYFKNSCK